MKHTRGPWKVYRARLRPQYAVVITEIQDVAGNAVVKWQGFDGIKQAIVKANARLIAAAPDLLEACKAVLAANGEDWEVGERVLRAAIKRAEGESRG